MVDINQLAAVRPERYPLSQPRSELVHTGDDPVLVRGRAVAARRAHNPEVAGSNPVFAIGIRKGAFFILRPYEIQGGRNLLRHWGGFCRLSFFETG